MAKGKIKNKNKNKKINSSNYKNKKIKYNEYNISDDKITKKKKSKIVKIKKENKFYEKKVSPSKKQRLNKNYYIQRKGNKLIIFNSNGKIKAQKKYNKETYSQDLQNAKYQQNFKDYKKETRYGKKVTWRSTGRTQKYYNLYSDNKPKFISQKTISKKEFFIVYCEGYLIKDGYHRVHIKSSSHRYRVDDVSVEFAKQEATENFYYLALGEYNGTGSERPTKNSKIYDKAIIERYYISYKDFE